MKMTKDSIYNFFNSTRWTDSAMLFLRIFGGGMLLYHGIQKIQNYNFLTSSFPSMLGMSGSTALSIVILVEVGCSILIIMGALTRLALIPAAFTMCVASFFGHSGGAFGELAFIYLGLFVTLFIAGPGMYSLDRLLFVPAARKAVRKAKKS